MVIFIIGNFIVYICKQDRTESHREMVFKIIDVSR